MSILDTFVSVAKETGGYGTATSSSARAFESKTDDFQRDVEYIESVGFRKDMQTIRSDRHKTISVGATGSIEMDIQNKGLGLLLEGALKTATSPSQLGSTAAYKSVFESGDALSSVSYTVQVGKADTAGSLQSFTYEGSQITGWSIGQELGNNASMTFNFDCENEQNSTALATPKLIWFVVLRESLSSSLVGVELGFILPLARSVPSSLSVVYNPVLDND